MKGEGVILIVRVRVIVGVNVGVKVLNGKRVLVGKGDGLEVQVSEAKGVAVGVP